MVAAHNSFFAYECFSREAYNGQSALKTQMSDLRKLATTVAGSAKDCSPPIVVSWHAKVPHLFSYNSRFYVRESTQNKKLHLLI